MDDTSDLGNLVDAILSVRAANKCSTLPSADGCRDEDVATSPDTQPRRREHHSGSGFAVQDSDEAGGSPVTAGYLLLDTTGHDDMLVSQLPECEDDALDGTAEAESSEPTEAPADCSPSIKISVNEPERADMSTALGLKSQQWLYAIAIDSTLPGLIARGIEVRRTFSDFEALHKVLHAEFIGCFLPSLPQKAFLESNSADVLKGKRQDLQRYLRCVAAHPVLRHSDALKIFLLQPGELGQNAAWCMVMTASKRPGLPGVPNQELEDMSIAPHQSANSSGGSATLAQIGNWMSRVKQSTVAAFQPARRELPAGEPVLRQAKELLHDLERLLELATQSARTLCIDTDKLATDLHDFGYHMSMLSKYEEVVQAKFGQYTPDGHSASHRGADCQALAVCQAKQSVAWRTLAVKCANNLVTLQDYFLLMPEAVRAMEQREVALENVFQLEDELASKRHELEELQQASAEPSKGLLRTFSVGAGMLSRQEKKSYRAQQAIAVLEDEHKAALATYELIKYRNLSELTRLGLEREADFRRMMAQFAASQAKMVLASAKMWAALASRFAPWDT